MTAVNTVAALLQAEKITKELLLERQEESSYWDSVYKFCIQNWSREITSSLSVKQNAWLTKIIDDMVEWRIERKG